MKKFFWAAACLFFAISGAATAQTRSIPLPASSVGGGGVAAVAITPMSPGDVVAIVRSSPIQNQAGQSWTKYFVGRHTRQVPGTRVNVTVDIAPDGSVNYNWNRWDSSPPPYLNNAVSFNADPCIYLAPSSVANPATGGPAGFEVVNGWFTGQCRVDFPGEP